MQEEGILEKKERNQPFCDLLPGRPGHPIFKNKDAAPGLPPYDALWCNYLLICILSVIYGNHSYRFLFFIDKIEEPETPDSTTPGFRLLVAKFPDILSEMRLLL